jgi:hypothetical protein
MTVHGLLAADICLDKTQNFKIWKAVFPTMQDFASTPLLWDPKLQELLPGPASTMLSKQKIKLEKDWKVVSAAFPAIERKEYVYAWLLVNSRTFYYVTPATEKYSRDDRMVLQPVADLFNHADDGCSVTFDAESYVIKTDRSYASGEEIFINYGHHSNDFLLVEYGFILEANKWDETSLDGVLRPMLAEAGGGREKWVDEAGFLGNYMLDRSTVCWRTQTALRALFMSKAEFRKFLKGAVDEGVGKERVVELLRAVLERYDTSIGEKLKEVEALDVGEECQKRVLRERWEQIRSMAATARTIRI